MRKLTKEVLYAMTLDQKNPIPLHVQLKYEIEKQIQNGNYKTKIPSEREIMETYSISRTTVREAISQLVYEGILEKKHGKGTFVPMKSIQDWLGTLRSTTNIIKKMGMKPDARLIWHGIVTPSKNIQDLCGNPAYYIKRVRYADDKPIAIEKQYYPLEIGKKLAKYDIKKGTLYDLLENELNINFSVAEQVITSDRIPKEEAKHLKVPEDHSVLITERMTYDTEGELVEYYEAYFRSDMYSFNIQLSRKKNS
ncbi:GntR family transcriptional regulator [Alkalihalobacillus deserti]|uniref:GntR family transcriptional regulator n=1 Tax=Alkalihalobacillus deserti TaxID=2879466 RepID=UPI001D156D51|nr:GntR family transcriptional regulator [Alkalihalobacillus deserti]